MATRIFLVANIPRNTKHHFYFLGLDFTLEYSMKYYLRWYSTRVFQYQLHCRWRHTDGHWVIGFLRFSFDSRRFAGYLVSRKLNESIRYPISFLSPVFRYPPEIFPGTRSADSASFTRARIKKFHSTYAVRIVETIDTLCVSFVVSSNVLSGVF